MQKRLKTLTVIPAKAGIYGEENVAEIQHGVVVTSAVFQSP